MWADVDKEIIEDIMEKCYIGDWFVLHLLSKNTNLHIYKRVIKCLANVLRERKSSTVVCLYFQSAVCLYLKSAICLLCYRKTQDTLWNDLKSVMEYDLPGLYVSQLFVYILISCVFMLQENPKYYSMVWNHWK